MIILAAEFWTVLKGGTLKTESGKEVVARYRIKTDYLTD
jgi:hypothetical protein